MLNLQVIIYECLYIFYSSLCTACTVVQCLLFVHKHAMGHNSACFFSEFSNEINDKTVLNFIKLLTARSPGNRCPTVGGKKADASATIHYTV